MGKTNITMERSTIFHGKTHYFDWAIINSFLYVYQRVSFSPNGDEPEMTHFDIFPQTFQFPSRYTTFSDMEVS